MDTITAELEPLAADEPAAFPLSQPARALLAVLLVAAGIIHFAMVPSHAGEWLPEGIAFAIAGWVQIGLAVAILARPSKRWLALAIVANLVFVAAWAYTRTIGLQFGPHQGKELATFIDLTCVGLEAALVLSAAVFLQKPRLGEDWKASALIPASIVPIGIIALTTATMASPSASNHAHGAEHGAEVAAGDHSAQHANSGGAEHDMAGMDHSHDATAAAVPAAARCDWDFNTVGFWNSNPPAAADPNAVHTHSHDPSASGGGETVGNQKGTQAWKPLTDPAQCAQMKADLQTMQDFAKKYPTAQDAMNAGCARVTIYVPGIAAHYACFQYWDGKLDVNHPEMLLYGGSQPWAPMVGLSYYSTGATTPDSSWEFGQMPFHVHNGLCVKGTLVIGADGSDPAQCASEGGRVMGKTGFMGHYWLPNCSSPDGVFSAENPRLDMGVANYNDDPKFDPSQGGDPTQLQANPCTGSKMTAPDPFGQPGSAPTEQASGKTN